MLCSAPDGNGGICNQPMPLHISLRTPHGRNVDIGICPTCDTGTCSACHQHITVYGQRTCPHCRAVN